MALSLVAGFPETAYINGLLVLAWAVLRGVCLPSSAARRGFGSRVTAGGMAALAIASPQIVAFLLYLPHADVGGHAGELAAAYLGPDAAVTSLIAPYAFGPIMGYGYKWDAIYAHWIALAGHFTIALLAIAVYGLLSRRDAVAFLL